MKLSAVIEHFGSKAAACKALGISKQAASKWGYWMPHSTARELEGVTSGFVRFDYSSNEVVLNDVKYIPATDIDYASRLKSYYDELWFFKGGEMIKAWSVGEALKLFRKYPPYRKG